MSEVLSEEIYRTEVSSKITSEIKIKSKSKDTISSMTDEG
ncbi:12285_t:CDS:2 [Funneliformis mosseae]|uniref:12285_t:CDS:1 n=1 Tax=Funneliformis mosseae TaxID=27381 RepID=A0A9N8Z4W8_FUNMO|nr:12285_t:CDS:2 [Funneliformis mosseae]